MAVLETVPISAIDTNPFRSPGKYPYVERKIEALMRSIADVGLWEGVIVRKHGNRYQNAFGHHRVKAAKDSGLTEIPVIVRELTDEQMLQFMGRENLEDYNADFLTMLETWEAGVRWSELFRAQSAQPIEVSKLLGWTRAQPGDRIDVRANNTADACHAASQLLKGGHIVRADLIDLTVHAARNICTRALATMERLAAMGKQGKRPDEEIKHAKKQVGKAVKKTARQSRAGEVAPKDLYGRVDLNTYRYAREAKKKSPLFELFGKQLADSLAKLLAEDATAEKLGEIQKAVTEVSLDEDKAVLRRLDYELDELSGRAQTWRRRITPTEKKVTRLQITGGSHE